MTSEVSPLDSVRPITARKFIDVCRSGGAYNMLRALHMRENPPTLAGFAGAYYPVWFLGLLNYQLADLIERLAGPEALE